MKETLMLKWLLAVVLYNFGPVKLTKEHIAAAAKAEFRASKDDEGVWYLGTVCPDESGEMAPMWKSREPKE